MSDQIKRKIELLAPGGDADSVKAAICAGADAVYCGTTSFNARQRASNLTIQELEQLAHLAAQRSCKLYLTLNTLIFDSELPEVMCLLKDIYQAGIRAVIVQDLGILHLLRTYLPEIEVHASTQLTTHNEGQIAFLSHFGISQINLSRELSIDEIEPLCTVAHEKNIKVEVFVHGAFCISFSGQCYFSSNLCGKSGNRGECVQPCRRQYTIATAKKESDAKTFFNLKDNFVFSEADKLYNAGVDSFKIEGRIKKFPYVYNVTSAWREQIDALQNGNDIKHEDKRLDSVFNRKFTSGYVKGTISADMFIDSSRDQSLHFVATVAGYWADKKVLTLDSKVSLAENTEILIYTPDFTFICKGIISKRISSMEYLFTIEHKLKGMINEGYQVYTQEFSDDADRIKSIIDNLTFKKVPLKVKVSGTIGDVLSAMFFSPEKSVTVYSQIPLSEASQRPLDKESLAAQFSRLGTSHFVLDKIDISNLSENSFIPQKELNRMRREAVDMLSDIAIVSSRFTIPPNYLPLISGKQIKKAFFIDDIKELPHSGKDADATVYLLPNCITDTSKTADTINQNKDIIPFFRSILIGTDFKKAVELLNKIDPRTIITDNSGIAEMASEAGRDWIAGPGFNIVNSYAIEALLRFKGFCGFFLSPEFSEKKSGTIRAPHAIDMWKGINYRRPLMTTRQCLIRNISGCNKKQCDENCLPNCNRSEMIINAQGKHFTIIKKPGFYTVVM
jgi:putative protease